MLFEWQIKYFLFIFFSGIVIYAMIIGRLPFRTPFKDEYQRQELLKAVQKGMTGYHEKEMHYLSTGKLANILEKPLI